MHLILLLRQLRHAACFALGELFDMLGCCSSESMGLGRSAFRRVWSNTKPSLCVAYISSTCTATTLQRDEAPKHQSQREARSTKNRGEAQVGSAPQSERLAMASTAHPCRGPDKPRGLLPVHCRVAHVTYDLCSTQTRIGPLLISKIPEEKWTWLLQPSRRDELRATRRMSCRGHAEYRGAGQRKRHMIRPSS